MAMQVNRPVTCTPVPPTSYHKSPWEKRGVACKVYVLSHATPLLYTPTGATAKCQLSTLTLYMVRDEQGCPTRTRQ